MCRVQIIRSETNLDSIISFVDSSPHYNRYYLMLRELRQNVVKEQYKRGTQVEISSLYKRPQ
jgi:hypothetical protein